MRTHSIDTQTNNLGYINVEFTYEYNEYDNFFELLAVEDVVFAHDSDGGEIELDFDSLDKEDREEIESDIDNWLIWDANTGDYFESIEEEMR